MQIAFLIGRIIVALYYISAGARHFKDLDEMAKFTGSKGVPMPKAGVVVTGSMLILGGLSLGLGAYPLIGAILIIVFLLMASFMINNFWTLTDPMHKMNEMVNFTKNWALIGYTLMILAIPQPWPWSV